MIVRIGRVTTVYPDEGRVVVYYEDRNLTSAKLPLLTFNGEFTMPEINAVVLTLHMENNSCDGFVLGTYWNDNLVPSAGTASYKKNLGNDSYIETEGTETTIHATELTLSCAQGTLGLTELLSTLQDFAQRISALEN